jgi:para-nitrobenzyl esterase
VDGPVVETISGKVRGLVHEGVSVFKSMPYAAPPTGSRRFRPPKPADPWTGVRDAFEYGASCPQPATRPQGWWPETAESEDCLFLNVWTPDAADGQRRPVMVWIHGGGFSIGSGSWPLYDGAALARRGDVVVVTVNHRLGIFGYLHLGPVAGPEFASSGNAGMLDLVASLQWVRDNIEAFGGDPDNVTVFGESGGGAKVCTLLAMPGARGLFHRAAVQSGASLRLRSIEDATKVAERTLGALEITPDQIDALQALPSDRLLAANPTIGQRGGRSGVMAYTPVLDGAVTTGHPEDALANGTAPDVPILIGSNRDEATLFLRADPVLKDPQSLEGDGLARRLASLGESADKVIAAYRAGRPDASPRDLLIAIESDRMVRVPSITLAERRLAGGNAPVFMYLFTWAAGPLGSAHGFEIPFVFDNVRPPVMEESAGRTTLAARMSEAWLGFARSGEPGHAALPPWPAYTLGHRATMIFDRGACHIQDDPSGDERRAWANTNARMGVAV